MKTTNLLLVIGLLVVCCFTQTTAQGNETLDLLLMGIDNPTADNAFRYVIAENIRSDGASSRITDFIQLSELGFSNSGGGATKSASLMIISNQI